MSDPAPRRGADQDTYVVGVDLGGTKIRAGLASMDGSILSDRTVRTSRSGAEVKTQLVEITRQLSHDAGIEVGSIMATGVGGAGVPDLDDDGFSRAPNLALMDRRGFRASLVDALGHDVVLENDVNVAAVGELHCGVGRKHRNFVCISVGTGVGMGIVVDGRLMRGAHSAAGEIGYLPIGEDPLDPANHRRGPLEEILAGDRLVQRFTDATGHDVDAETVFERALAGDAQASKAIDVEAKWLAHAILAVNAVLDTEVVVLTGGIGGRPELLRATTDWLTRLGWTRPPVIQSGLGADAPIIGAVRLALDAIHDETRGDAR
ncbi:MAG TPA: ROK family protein [Marmoricola sp.]|jgi:predicted NBD/HSP70 family sugar kinase